MTTGYLMGVPRKIGFILALLVMACLLHAPRVAVAAGANDVAADLVFVNARVYTVDPTQPRAQAVAVKEGQIVYVGGRSGADDHISGTTQVIDLQGKMLLPGFIDTHNHVFEGASEIGGNCELAPELSLRRQAGLLRECRERVENPGDWVIGYGHQFDTLMQDDPRTNPRKLLDKIFPDNPVIIMEESSHSMIVNSLALELAGIDEHSAHPVGGRLMYSPKTDKLNGVLFDNAGDIVMELAWNSQTDNFQVSYEGLIAGMEEATAHGITTIGDGRMYWRRGWHSVWQRAQEDDELIVRTVLRPWIYPEVAAEEQLEFLQTIYQGDVNSLLIANQVKMYADGILHFGTARVLKPYRWSWQTDLPRGLNYISPGAMWLWLLALDEIGYGAHIHAIGDRGVRRSLDAIAGARNAGSARKYGMTHLEMVAPGDRARFRSLDVDADFQAGAEFFADHNWAVSYLGRGRAKQLMPMRAIFDAGANVTFSSDWTVNSINPLVAIANSYRLRRSQGLPTIDDAIRAATINGAVALGLDAITGSIEVGKSADLVVLERDITRLSANQIEATRVDATYLQGVRVF